VINIQTNITKQSISAGEMFSMICVEWAGDHLFLGLTYIDSLLTKICAKTIFTFAFPATLTFDLQTSDLFP